MADHHIGRKSIAGGWQRSTIRKGNLEFRLSVLWAWEVITPRLLIIWDFLFPFYET